MLDHPATKFAEIRRFNHVPPPRLKTQTTSSGKQLSCRLKESRRRDGQLPKYANLRELLNGYGPAFAYAYRTTACEVALARALPHT